jgi:hypothetical protein
MVTKAEQMQNLVKEATEFAVNLGLDDDGKARFINAYAKREVANPNEVITGDAAKSPLVKETIDMEYIAERGIAAKENFARAEALIGTPAEEIARKWQVAARELAQFDRSTMDMDRFKESEKAMDHRARGLERDMNDIPAMQPLIASIGGATRSIDFEMVPKAVKETLKKLDTAREFDVQAGVERHNNDKWREIPVVTKENTSENAIDHSIVALKNLGGFYSTAQVIFTGEEPSDKVTVTMKDARVVRQDALTKQNEATVRLGKASGATEETINNVLAANMAAADTTPAAVINERAKKTESMVETAGAIRQNIVEKANKAGLKGQEVYNALADKPGTIEYKTRNMTAQRSELRSGKVLTDAAPLAGAANPKSEAEPKAGAAVVEPKVGASVSAAKTETALETSTAMPVVDVAKTVKESFATDMQYNGGAQWETAVNLKEQAGKQVAVTNVKDIGDSMVELRANKANMVFEAADIAGGKSNFADRAADQTRYMAMMGEDGKTSGTATIKLTQKDLNEVKTIQQFDDPAMGGQRVIIEYNNGKKTDLRAQEVKIALDEGNGKMGNAVALNVDNIMKLREEALAKAGPEKKVDGAGVELTSAKGVASGPESVGSIRSADGKQFDIVAKDSQHWEVAGGKAVAGTYNMLGKDNKIQTIEVTKAGEVFSAAPPTPTPNGGGNPTLVARR